MRGKWILRIIWNAETRTRLRKRKVFRFREHWFYCFSVPRRGVWRHAKKLFKSLRLEGETAAAKWDQRDFLLPFSIVRSAIFKEQPSGSPLSKNRLPQFTIYDWRNERTREEKIGRKVGWKLKGSTWIIEERPEKPSFPLTWLKFVVAPINRNEGKSVPKGCIWHKA